jgi:hypothetical protein
MSIRSAGRGWRPGALLLAAGGVLAALLPVVPPAAAGSTPQAVGAGETTPAPAAGDGATVTVSRTTGLVNQTITVSWAGFRPSSATRLQNTGDSLDVNTQNPVRVYQCRGTDPQSSSDCYGSPGFRGIDATDTSPAYPAVPAFTYPGQTDPFDATPDGPANWQDNVTRADGTGEVTIQVFTKRESAGLGCDVDAPCSIVVVPTAGRPPGATEDLMDAPWAWERRAVVPLTFLPVDDACPLSGTSLRVEGSPVAAGLLETWRGKTCTLTDNSVRLDYTAIGEPQTREDVAAGVTGLGLVIDPLDADAGKSRGVVYAPVSITGLVVAFQVDDANGRPVSSMRLNARLVAKLVTASYRSGGDPAVIDNPVNIFRDPEFLKLNPGVQWPGGAPGNHPLLLGDLSDTTSALTRWLWHDRQARAFLQGKPDPWGMTVNSNYKNVAMPFANFPLLDQNLSTTFEPISGMDTLARQLSIAQFPGALVTEENGQNITTKPPRQNPGAREVIGIIDAADAARFQLPTASLQNTGGAYVAPTDDSLLDAMRHASTNPDGVTRAVDLDSSDKGIYPLTLLVSAALSTHADAPERKRMAAFLDYVAGPGQVPGDQIGRLPAGHAPLPASMRDEVRAARAAVLAGPQDTDPTDPTDPTDDTDPGSDVPGSDSPGDQAPGDAPGSDDPKTQTAAAPPLGQSQPASMSTVASESAGRRLLALPALLALALVGLALGPSLLWLERSGRGPQWLRR